MGGHQGPSPPPGTHLHEVVDGLQVGQVVVVDVHADAEVEAGVASVNDLEVPELRAERRSGTGCPRAQRAGQSGPEPFLLSLPPPEALRWGHRDDGHGPGPPFLGSQCSAERSILRHPQRGQGWAAGAERGQLTQPGGPEGFLEEGAPDLRSGG